MKRSDAIVRAVESGSYHDFEKHTLAMVEGATQKRYEKVQATAPARKVR